MEYELERIVLSSRIVGNCGTHFGCSPELHSLVVLEISREVSQETADAHRVLLFKQVSCVVYNRLQFVRLLLNAV